MMIVEREKQGAIESFAGDALVVLAHEAPTLSGPLGSLDAAAEGFFTKMLARKVLATDVGTAHIFHQVSGIAAASVVVVGAGSVQKFDQGAAFRCGGSATKLLATHKRASVLLAFGSLERDVAAAAIAGAMNGCQGQDLLRAERKLWPIERLGCWEVEQAAIERGTALGEGMLLTRELVNLPANYMYPEAFAHRAAMVSLSEGLELEVWDELRLRREGCGALLAVSAGSARPPRLLVMRYRGSKSQPPLALVGKGVTFDSGGLSLKPSDGMLTMKCDMAGAATVLGAMQTLARLQIESPVVGLVGLVENMISGTSFKLGDVLTARSGMTIEIHNTDAEGRLVLADLLNVALDEKPAQIIDLATLTGACVVALGTDIAGLMGNDDALLAEFQTAARRAGELVWPLPMYAHFDEQIKSKIADIKNVGDGRWGGATTAAKFLEQFVAGTPWLHIDIAGPAFGDNPKPHLDGGATAALLRGVVAYAETL